MTDRSPQWVVTDDHEDITDPHFFAGDRHHEIWREARRKHPIAWLESGRDGGFWSITGHELGNQVLRQPGLFCSAQGMRLGSNPASIRAAAERMLVVSDGERHRALRTAQSAWFNSKAISVIHPDLERTVNDLLSGVLGTGAPFDAVSELGVKVPMWVLFEMMGVPEKDRAELVHLTTTAFDDGNVEAGVQATAHTAIFAYFLDLLYRRRSEPGPDMVTSLAQAEVNGRKLSDEEIILNCDGLLNGGLETTPHAISGALLAFAQHPDQWHKLKQNPELTEIAVEEILRWTSPPMHAMRTTTDDTVLGPAHVGKGDRVAVWIPSCNRDESVFPDADVFRIDRQPNPHICFGAGPHYCIGALLARIELRCFIAAIVGQVATIEVSGEVLRQRSNFLNGLTRLGVSMKPETRGSC